MRSLFVVGADGFATQDSGALHETSLAHRPYFQVHREDPDLGLHIGQPLRSLTTGSWFISLSRRITNADGSFGGVVVAAVEPRYFKRFYENISIGEDALISLLLRDGTLARSHTRPRRDHRQGPTPSSSVAQTGDRATAVASTWGASPVDQTRRIVGYRTLAGGSLIVMVGWPEDTSMTPGSSMPPS